MANDPNLVLADELTGNLDSKTGEEVMHLLRMLNKEEGKTFVFITHDQEVGRRTDRIILFKDGLMMEENR